MPKLIFKIIIIVSLFSGNIEGVCPYGARSENKSALRPPASANLPEAGQSPSNRKAQIAKTRRTLREIKEAITRKLEVEERVFVLIDGPSRAGKSTLAEALSRGSYGIDPNLISLNKYDMPELKLLWSTNTAETTRLFNENFSGKRLVIVDGIYSSRIPFTKSNCLRIWVDANMITRLWNAFVDDPGVVLETLLERRFPYPGLSKTGPYDFELSLNLWSRPAKRMIGEAFKEGPGAKTQTAHMAARQELIPRADSSDSAQFLYIQSNDVLWRRADFECWLRENVAEELAEEIISSQEFNKLAPYVIKARNMHHAKQKRRRYLLVKLFGFLGMAEGAGDLVSRFLGHNLIVKMDMRVAVPVTDKVFLVAEEVMRVMDVGKYIVHNICKGKWHDEESVVKAFQRIKGVTGMHIPISANDKFLEYYYDLLLSVAGLMKSPHLEWYKGNKDEVKRCLDLLYKKDNCLLNIDDAIEGGDDAIRIILAHEFLHGEIEAYFKGLNRCQRLGFCIRRFKVLLPLSVLGKELFHKSGYDLSGFLFSPHNINEFVTLLTYPPDFKDAKTRLGDTGEIYFTKEDASATELMELYEELRLYLPRIFTFLEAAKKRALERANETVKKARHIIELVRTQPDMAKTNKASPPDKIGIDFPPANTISYMGQRSLDTIASAA